ncbi:rho GTPase-activating protein [Mortierella sp. GBA30]|nr:rho GTPase-activating protein [Mortierella sp. GBA30]
MSNHARKEASTKNSASLANLRASAAEQTEATPRKTVSHEGFQKPPLASNASSSSGLSSNSGSVTIAGHTHAATPASSSTPADVQSGGSVSAFSYLKAKLFGSVADASTSLTTSARDLLQSKKNPEMAKGAQDSVAKASAGRASGEPTSPLPPPDLQYTPSPAVTGDAGDTDPTSRHPNDSYAGAHLQLQQHHHQQLQQQQLQAHSPRFFSRTLPSRRQPQPEPLQFGLGKPAKAGSSADQGLLSASDGCSPSPSTSPSTLLVPSPRSAFNQTIDQSQTQSQSQNQHQSQRRMSVLSLTSSQKHLSTGSLIYQEGFLNKKMELNSGEIGHGWKVYKVLLKSSKLYFYKPLVAEERPRFQDPKDHQGRHHLSPHGSLRSGQHLHHLQHSTSSIVSPRLSIASESGMVLTASKFESSTRTLLFEGNAISLNQGALAMAPPVSKYVYGECFTEIDRSTMQFKKHVALLLFEDSIIICKRKWIRYTSTKMKDAIKFNSSNVSHEKNDSQDIVPCRRQPSISGASHKSNDSRSSEGDQRPRSNLERPADKQRGYFTKWKHEAMYPLSQVEALDMASPVPTSSTTFYPFAAPATTALGSPSAVGRNPRDSDASSIYTTASIPTYNHQTTSTLELVITSNIDGKEFTHRLLFLPPSQEVRHQWYSKFNRVKEIYQAHSKPSSSGRASTENLALSPSVTDAFSPRSPHSAISPYSPTSLKCFSESSNFVLDTQKMNRARAFCETSAHPELTLRLDDTTGKEKLFGASINGLVHELVYNNLAGSHSGLVYVFATTYPLFTTTLHVLKELKRCTNLRSANTSKGVTDDMSRRVETLLREMIKGYNGKIEDRVVLEEIQRTTKIVLQESLKWAAADRVLKDIDAMLQGQVQSPPVPVRESSAQSIRSLESSVDLSNVLITGLTPALFLRLEPSQFAEQVLRYHSEQLNKVGGFIALLNNPAFFMRQYPTAASTRNVQSPLVFSMYSPHFLTVLITHHILIATQSLQSTCRRPKLLAQWIRTAQGSRALGDMAGFMAIAIGVCSPGVVRLQESWKHVPLDLRLEVAETWVPLLIKMDMVTEDLQELAISSFDLKPSLNVVIDPSLGCAGTVAVPCISNIKQSVDQLDRAMPSFIQSTPVPMLSVDKLEHIHAILNRAKKSLQGQVPRSRVALPSAANGHLQQYFGHLASISQTLHDQYHANELSNDAFESSLACEPHFNGQYLDYHYKNRKMTGSFIPLMFPEMGPEYRLFPLQLLLSLENNGNTHRKSSFDETHPFQSTATKENHPKQPSGHHVSVTGQTESTECVESLATHHGATRLSVLNNLSYPKSRKRTYSFPPSRIAPRASGEGKGAGSPHMINMINPHLDTVARDCLYHYDEMEQNDVLQAMRHVAGIGYSMISIEGGNLVLKAKNESLETLVKAVIMEEEAQQQQSSTADQKPATNGNQGSNRNSLLVLSGARPVMVKAGTLEMLIHVLVTGLEGQSGKYTDENGDMIPWTSRQLVLDQDAFMDSFFATYRSFCTPARLLDQLVTMFTFADESRNRESHIPSGLDIFSGSRQTNLPGAGAGGSICIGDHSLFNWKKILTMQLRVLKAVERWLTVYFVDFLDDLTLKAKLAYALKSMCAQTESQKLLMDDSLRIEARSLDEKLRFVRRLAVQQSMKPTEATILGSYTVETFFGLPPSVEPQLEDHWSADQILEQLNSAVLPHFLSVRAHEWFVLFEVLESQSADPLGWYLPKTNTLPEEDVVITGIHNTLHVIRKNGALGTNWNGQQLVNALPICLQNLFRLHHIMRGWLITQVASPNIPFEVRLVRVQKLLDVILQSRSAMSQFGSGARASYRTLSSPSSDLESSVIGGVPSFVETAVVSALISPESRAYTRLWLEVAKGRRGSLETLEEVLRVHQEQRQPIQPATRNMSTNGTDLVPAMGWLIERMLETCCYVRDMSYESPLLVNFDKRQYVHDLVGVFTRRQEQLRALLLGSDIKATVAQATPLAAWLGQSTGPGSNVSMKTVREAAHREMTYAQRNVSTGQLSSISTTSSSARAPLPRPVKVFARLVAIQQEKIKRDQKEYEKLDRQIKDTQGRIQKAQQEQARTLEKQIKLEQSRSRVKNQLLKSTLMRAMRPISMAITNSWSSATTTVSNATALGSAISGRVMGGNAVAGSGGSGSSPVMADFGLNTSPEPGLADTQQNHSQARSSSYMTGSIHSSTTMTTTTSTASMQKPALVINLINSTCSVAYTYTKRDYVFKIVTEEGGQSLLQALDYEDMLKWIKVMNEAAAEATAKRRTLLDYDESLKTALETAAKVDEMPLPVENERKGRNSVFGVELRHLMSDGSVPLIVEKCIAEIEKRGLEEVGIYRVPGAVSSINKLRLSFNSGSHNVDLDSDEWKDINVVAGALKQFLRELPEAVMTNALYDSLITASALEDYDERLMAMKDLIRTMPSNNYLLLKRIIEHLERVTDYEEINHMYATNLAIVFGPTLLRPAGSSANSFATSMKNLGHQQNIVRNMILQYHWLFDVEGEEEEQQGQETQENANLTTTATVAGGEEVEEGDVFDDEEGLGEFPEILEDSDEDDEYEEERERERGRGVETDEEILMLTAASLKGSATTTTTSVDQKSTTTITMGLDERKATKSQRRKTMVFG